MKVIVRVKREIARTGNGFTDIAGKQEIRPPRHKNGTPVIDHELAIELTPFVEAKIRSGELEVIRREETAPRGNGIPVMVNGKEVSRVALAEGMTEEAVSEEVLTDKKVKEFLGERQIKKFSVKKDAVIIEVK